MVFPIVLENQMHTGVSISSVATAAIEGIARRPCICRRAEHLSAWLEVHGWKIDLYVCSNTNSNLIGGHPPLTPHPLRSKSNLRNEDIYTWTHSTTIVLRGLAKSHNGVRKLQYRGALRNNQKDFDIAAFQIYQAQIPELFQLDSWCPFGATHSLSQKFGCVRGRQQRKIPVFTNITNSTQISQYKSERVWRLNPTKVFFSCYGWTRHSDHLVRFTLRFAIIQI